MLRQVGIVIRICSFILFWNKWILRIIKSESNNFALHVHLQDRTSIEPWKPTTKFSTADWLSAQILECHESLVRQRLEPVWLNLNPYTKCIFSWSTNYRWVFLFARYSPQERLLHNAAQQNDILKFGCLLQFAHIEIEQFSPKGAKKVSRTGGVPLWVSTWP